MSIASRPFSRQYKSSRFKSIVLLETFKNSRLVLIHCPGLCFTVVYFKLLESGSLLCLFVVFVCCVVFVVLCLFVVFVVWGLLCCVCLLCLLCCVCLLCFFVVLVCCVCCVVFVCCVVACDVRVSAM